MLRPELTEGIIGAFYDVYNALHFGFLESVYAGALEAELRERGLDVAREVPIEVHFRGRIIGSHRLDMVVSDAVIVELKATRFLDSSAEAQVLNYLRATRLEIGLLLHFGPRPSFKRFISTNKPGMFFRDAVPPR